MLNLVSAQRLWIHEERSACTSVCRYAALCASTCVYLHESGWKHLAEDVFPLHRVLRSPCFVECTAFLRCQLPQLLFNLRGWPSPVCNWALLDSCAKRGHLMLQRDGPIRIQSEDSQANPNGNLVVQSKEASNLGIRSERDIQVRLYDMKTQAACQADSCYSG